MGYNSTFWVIQTMNAFSLGGLLFVLSVGFSLIFGLMRVPNLSHGAFFMLGAYLGLTALRAGLGFWPGVLVGGLGVGALGVVVERLLLRRLHGRPLPQVLVTLGIALIIADGCLAIWSGDPVPIPPPAPFRGSTHAFGFFFPTYRLVIPVIALAIGIGLWFMLERTRLGAMIRAGVDDMEMARGIGIPVSRLFSMVFFLGCALAGMGGVLGAPILSVHPGLASEMLPLALLVVILGGVGSLGGAMLGSVLIGFVDVFGQALLPDLSYVILFLPMVIILIARPRGLLGTRAL